MHISKNVLYSVAALFLAVFAGLAIAQPRPDVTQSMYGHFQPVDQNVTVVDGNASTTGTVLSADLASTIGIRRVMIANVATSGTISLLLFPAGTDVSSKAVADGMKIPAGSFRTVDVTNKTRLGIVADGASVAYNAVISDM